MDVTEPLRHPAVDRFTARRAIVLGRRPVFGLSSGLVDALGTVAPAGRVLTLVTGPDARLTPPLHDLVAAKAVQWVVQPDGDGDSPGISYDGLEGRPLRFDRVDFTPLGEEPVPAFRDPHDEGDAVWQVLVSMSIEHRPGAELAIGRGLAAATQALTGVTPTGWGPYEPVTETWNPTAITEYVRDRLPEPTRLVVTAGTPVRMVATVEVQKTATGIEEEISALAVIGPTDQPPTEVAARGVEALAAVAEHDVVGFGWTHLRPGRADLTEVPAARAASVPTAVLIGPRAVLALGADSLRAAPLAEPRPVGSPRVPGLLWPLGGDTGLAGWDQLAELVTYLTPERIVGASPPLAAAIDARTPK